MRELYSEQRRVRSAIRRRRLLLRVGVIGLLLAVAFVGGLIVYSQIIEVPRFLRGARGATVSEVEARLGAAHAEWPAGSFECFKGYPCDLTKASGRVLFYWRSGYGCYAYFDINEFLVETECTGS